MTPRVGLILLFLACPTPAVAADEPGADRARLDEPAVQPHSATTPVGATATGWWSRRPRGPMVELSWRTFDLAEMAGRRGRWHLFAVDYLFISKLLRVGVGLEGGFAEGPQTHVLAGTDLRVGVQWPARITPSLDFVLGLGVLRQGVLHDNLVGFAWQTGFDGAVHVFVERHVFLSVAVGWRRVGHRQPGNDQVQPLYLFDDTFSVRVGVGL